LIVFATSAAKVLCFALITVEAVSSALHHKPVPKQIKMLELEFNEAVSA